MCTLPRLQPFDVLPSFIDRHRAFLPESIMATAAPAPLFRAVYQSSTNWVHVHVVEFLQALPLGDHVEVVKAQLPEANFGVSNSPRRPLLEHLHGERWVPDFRFAHEQMDVLRHNDVSEDDKVVFSPDLFQDNLETVSCFWCTKESFPPVTGEGDEVEVSVTVITPEMRTHGEIVTVLEA